MSATKNFLSRIDKSYCFIVDKRYQNWESIQIQLADRLGLNVEKFVSGMGGMNVPYDRVNVLESPPVYHNSTTYATWYSRPQAYNAWLSRRIVLEECQRNKYEYVAFFEDDIKIEDDFEEVLEKAIPFLEKNQWSALYFGAYHNPGSFRKTANDNVLELNGSGGWHGIILRQNVINDLLNFQAIGPWDEICGKYLHSVFNFYCINPGIINQTDGFSEVEGHHLSKPSRFLKV